jgi:hypothetical protein
VSGKAETSIQIGGALKHVLVAGTEEVARVLNAAKNRETVEGWIVPKKAHEGDKAIFYLPPHVLAARGEILGEPEGGQGEYRAEVRVIEKLGTGSSSALPELSCGCSF